MIGIGNPMHTIVAIVFAHSIAEPIIAARVPHGYRADDEIPREPPGDAQRTLVLGSGRIRTPRYPARRPARYR